MHRVSYSALAPPPHHFIRWSVKTDCNNLFLALASRGRHPANVDPYSVPEEGVWGGERENT